MESVVLLIGMCLSFVLGAYVRKPFEFKFKHKEEPAPKIDADIQALIDEEEKAEQRRQLQIFKALNWNGEKEILRDE